MSYFPTLFNKPFFFYIEGESNSVSSGTLSQANQLEIGLKNHVKTINYSTLASLESLKIGGLGANNSINNQGVDVLGFGFELEIARRSLINSFYAKNLYLLKVGQGGARISMWNTGGAYDIVALDRLNAFKSLIPTNVVPVILYSIGINDATSSTNGSTFKTLLIQRLAVLRSRLGNNTIVILTRFEGMGSGGNAYNYISAKIIEICNEIPNTYSVSGSETTLLGDLSHWDGQDTGVKLVTARMLDVLQTLLT